MVNHGYPWLTMDIHGHFPEKMARCIVFSQSSAPRGNSAPDPPDPPETQHAVRNRPWVPHAGARMTVVTQTPSNYHLLIFLTLCPLESRRQKWNNVQRVVKNGNEVSNNLEQVVTNVVQVSKTMKRAKTSFSSLYGRGEMLISVSHLLVNHGYRWLTMDIHG